MLVSSRAALDLTPVPRKSTRSITEPPPTRCPTLLDPVPSPVGPHSPAGGQRGRHQPGLLAAPDSFILGAAHEAGPGRGPTTWKGVSELGNQGSGPGMHSRPLNDTGQALTRCLESRVSPVWGSRVMLSPQQLSERHLGGPLSCWEDGQKKATHSLALQVP